MYIRVAVSSSEVNLSHKYKNNITKQQQTQQSPSAVYNHQDDAIPVIFLDTTIVATFLRQRNFHFMSENKFILCKKNHLIISIGLENPMVLDRL